MNIQTGNGHQEVKDRNGVEDITPRFQPGEQMTASVQSLFKEQEEILDFFFKNVDYERVSVLLEEIINCRNVIFVSGVGKSGFVAQKFALTLVSLGIRSLFLNPIDALHGDIGILGKGDLLLLFSKSGSSDEVVKLIPYARSRGARLIGMHCKPGSPLDSKCDVGIHIPLLREICPWNLAPVSSSAVQMLYCDTVSAAIMKVKNLTKEEYATNHPAGRIGKRLILNVHDVMRKGDALPVVPSNMNIMDALSTLTGKGCGCVLVVDTKGGLAGIITDGDIRRAIQAYGEGIFKRTAAEVMTGKCRSVTAEMKAVDALEIMEHGTPKRVSALPVVTADTNNVEGLLLLHDLVERGLL